MRVPNNPLAIKVYVFNNHPTRPDMMLGKGLTVHFHWQGDVFSGTVWGCEKPINIRLRPVPGLDYGEEREIGFHTSFEVPVRKAEMPSSIVIYNPPGYAAVLVPFTPRYRPPRRMWLSCRHYTDAEVVESRAACREYAHLAFIDFDPHKVPPPPVREEPPLLYALAA